MTYLKKIMTRPVVNVWGGGTQNGKRYIGELCLHKIFQKLLS